MTYPNTWADFNEYLHEMMPAPGNEFTVEITRQPTRAEPWYQATIQRDQIIAEGGGRFRRQTSTTSVQFTGYVMGDEYTIRFREPDACRMLVPVVEKACRELGLPVPDPPDRVTEIRSVDPVTANTVVEKFEPGTDETSEISIYNADGGALIQTITIDPESGVVEKSDTFDPTTGGELSSVEDPPVEDPRVERR